MKIRGIDWLGLGFVIGVFITSLSYIIYLHIRWI